MSKDFKLQRRRLLTSAILLVSRILSGAASGLAASIQNDLEPTPSCGAGDHLTPAQTAGPFFKPRSPRRVSLVESGIHGSPIILEGKVLSTKCLPVAGALVDFWQADGDGVYDNVGYKLRGHQFTDSAGKYRLQTVIPGVYPGRTRHFHVRVQRPNGSVLTTQLYFPDEPQNKSDFIFDPKLVFGLSNTPRGKIASFDFVLDI